jgi:hypothetical protein
MGLGLAYGPAAPAAFGQRQYYDKSWSYSPSHGYYYIHYHYRPAASAPGHDYNYCIYYPPQPGSIYYYDPAAQVYWGRYKIGSKGAERFSTLAEKDRKTDLKEVPESAFPAPGMMPKIPGSTDGVLMEPPPEHVPKEPPPGEKP